MNNEIKVDALITDDGHSHSHSHGLCPGTGHGDYGWWAIHKISDHSKQQ